jgi:hypothetical protein
MNEKSRLSLMFAVLVDASASWRGVKVSPAIAHELEALRTNPRVQPTTPLAA